MFLPPTIRTSFGPRFAEAPRLHRVLLTGRELHALAKLLGVQAVEAELAGELHLAERLAWRASELREAAR